jgi:hypothetical protein
MKLKDWAEKQGISYLTAWRWFKAGDPRLSSAYQSDSGTIIVPDDTETSEHSMNTVQSDDVMSLVLKKTVEFSNNSTVADFAAWILSNFNLKLKSVDGPKYSKVKPSSEKIQNHFKQFLKPKGEKPKVNMFVTTDQDALDELVIRSDDLTAQELVDEIHKIGADGGVPVNPNDAPEVGELMKDISSALAGASYSTNIKTYGNLADGVVMRSVDLTPQQFNYTGSASPAFSNNSYSLEETTSSCFVAGAAAAAPDERLEFNDSTFKPTQKELESASRSLSLADKPRRGRKRSKITGNE